MIVVDLVDCKLGAAEARYRFRDAITVGSGFSEWHGPHAGFCSYATIAAGEADMRTKADSIASERY